MAHHVQVTVPSEHAPAVHEALLSTYGRAAETLADAAGRRDPERLRDARAALLDADASVAGYGWSAGARLEGGHRSPNLRTIVRLADALGVPPAALLADLPEPAPPSARSPRVRRT